MLKTLNSSTGEGSLEGEEATDGTEGDTVSASICLIRISCRI